MSWEPEEWRQEPARLNLENERWRQERLAQRHRLTKTMDRWACAVADWVTDHAGLVWGIVLLVAFPILVTVLLIEFPSLR